MSNLTVEEFHGMGSAGQIYQSGMTREEAIVPRSMKTASPFGQGGTSEGFWGVTHKLV